jgi:hypothetical protein
MISTKNINTGGGSSVPKTLGTGNAEIKINNVRLETVPYKQDAYHVVLEAEGPALGADFQGFLIDKDDASKGNYAGQVGRIRYSEYPYSDGITKRGDVISRDEEVLKAIKNLCRDLQCESWFDSQDEKHDTIESLVSQFGSDKPYAGKFLRVCIAGREYQNKAGYTSYDLFLPKWSKDGLAMESASVDPSMSRVVKYNPELHIRKPKTQDVKSFGTDATSQNFAATSNVADEFEL